MLSDPFSARNSRAGPVMKIRPAETKSPIFGLVSTEGDRQPPFRDLRAAVVK